mmetsp:Transcript_4325/g.11221  ORF Transcript_4325/g.11221 Transcript_4325/m.11221 type:complete len:385 (+) Transcript_4325:334-1488(+)
MYRRTRLWCWRHSSRRTVRYRSSRCVTPRPPAPPSSSSRVTGSARSPAVATWRAGHRAKRASWRPRYHGTRWCSRWRSCVETLWLVHSVLATLQSTCAASRSLSSACVPTMRCVRSISRRTRLATAAACGSHTRCTTSLCCAGWCFRRHALASEVVRRLVPCSPSRRARSVSSTFSATSSAAQASRHSHAGCAPTARCARSTCAPTAWVTPESWSLAARWAVTVRSARCSSAGTASATWAQLRSLLASRQTRRYASSTSSKTTSVTQGHTPCGLGCRRTAHSRAAHFNATWCKGRSSLSSKRGLPRSTTTTTHLPMTTPTMLMMTMWKSQRTRRPRPQRSTAPTQCLQAATDSLRLLERLISGAPARRRRATARTASTVTGIIL